MGRNNLALSVKVWQAGKGVKIYSVEGPETTANPQGERMQNVMSLMRLELNKSTNII